MTMKWIKTKGDGRYPEWELVVDNIVAIDDDIYTGEQRCRILTRGETFYSYEMVEEFKARLNALDQD